MSHLEEQLHHESVLDDFISELKEYTRDEPRIHLKYSFPDMPEKTMIEIFDQYALVYEMGELPDGERQMFVVAIARSLNDGYLNYGTIQLIDVRTLDHPEIFTDAQLLLEKLRDKYLGKNEKELIVIDGTFEINYFVQLIIASWHLAHEMDTSVFH